MSEKKSGAFSFLKTVLFVMVLAAAYCFGFMIASVGSGILFLGGFYLLSVVLHFAKRLTAGWIFSQWFHLVLLLASYITYYVGFAIGLWRFDIQQTVQKFFMPF